MERMDGTYTLNISLILNVRAGLPVHLAASNATIEYFTINNHGEFFNDYFLDKEKTCLTLHNRKNVSPYDKKPFPSHVHSLLSEINHLNQPHVSALLSSHATQHFENNHVQHHPIQEQQQHLDNNSWQCTDPSAGPVISSNHAGNKFFSQDDKNKEKRSLNHDKCKEQHVSNNEAENHDRHDHFENIGLTSKLYEVDMIIPHLQIDATNPLPNNNQNINTSNYTELDANKSPVVKKYRKLTPKKRKRELCYSEPEVLEDGVFMCRWPYCGYKVLSSDALTAHFREHTGESEEPSEAKKVNYYSASKLYSNTISMSLRRHTVHGQIKFEFECSWPSCGLGLQSKEELTRHVKLHTGEKCVPCDKCDFECASSAELMSHMNECHPSGVTTIECEVCNIQVSSKKELRLHMKHSHKDVYEKEPRPKKPKKSIEPNSVLCDICAKSFTFASQLKKHILRVHNINPVSCSVCESVFKNDCALKNHMAQVHLSTTVMCQLCGKHYKKNKIKTHIQVVHERSQTVRCEWPNCNQICTSSKSHKVHMRRHTGDKRIKCEICGFGAIQRASMNYHMQKHHPEVSLHNIHKKAVATLGHAW